MDWPCAAKNKGREMLFWVREVLGWLLVVVALWILKSALDYVTSRQVVEAGTVALVGLGVLRAGVLLIRVSTAARIALKDVVLSEVVLEEEVASGRPKAAARS